MAGLINIGLSGVLSHQQALNTTGNNITNANTPGYSRQQTVFESTNGERTGNGTVGTGVTINDVRRVASDFITSQIRNDTSNAGSQESLNNELSRLDNLLGGESTGLNKTLNNFFNSIQSAAEDPAALPQRQLVLSEGQAVVDRFRALHEEFVQQRESVNSQMRSGAKDVTSLLNSIADLNLQISETPGLAQGREPNDLLDKRDERLRELSELINIRVVDGEGGQVNVQMGNGQALVTGADAAGLITERDDEDPSNLAFILRSGGRERDVSGQITGGSLGGLQAFVDKALNPAFDELGRVAIAFSDQLNQQHQIGMDLEGDLGGLFFSDVNSRAAQLNRVTPNENNAAPNNALIGVEITDSELLDSGAYTLEFRGANGNNYELVDRTTGETVRQGRLPATLPEELSLNGFNIRIEDGDFSEGDSFLIRPTRSGAADIGLEVQREEDLAFASPIRAEADNGNSGNGSINQGTMLDVRNPRTNVPLEQFSQRGELNPPLMVRFTDTNEYEILDASDPSNPVSLDPAIENQTFQAGIANRIFSEDPRDDNYRGFQFEITGNPQAGDLFSIDYNSDGISDNRNAGLLGEFATRDTMNGGNQSFTEAYGGLVEDIGVQTRQSQLDLEAGQTLLEQSTNQRESMSGVNLDEEAGRLIQYQAAYNGSAQVMSVAQELFDTLLGTFR